MKLTDKLLGFLNRVFDKDPERFAAIDFSYAGTSSSWSVVDGILSVAVTGGAGSGFTLDLSQYTIASLVVFIGGRAGFTVTAANTLAFGLSALVLIDGSGNNNDPN